MTGMKFEIKYVQREIDRYGNERFYFRKDRSKRVRLRGPLGSTEFWSDYNDAIGKPTVDSKTLSWLCGQYYNSGEYQQLNPRTRRVRENILSKFCRDHGDRRYKQLEPSKVRKIRDGMADRPEAANSLIKALRQLYGFAVEYDLAKDNPAAAVKYLKPKNKDGVHAWTLGEIEKFEEHYPIGTKARLALALLLYTAQRRGDVIKLGRQMVRDGWLTFTQEKTGQRMEIPIVAHLQEIIDASPTGDLTYIVTQFHKPFSSAGFGNWFRKRCDEAGLSHCSAHGLRKAAAAKMADSGCTTQEIMAITGHTSIKEVERYTRSADQKRRAGQAMQKIK